MRNEIFIYLTVENLNFSALQSRISRSEEIFHNLSIQTMFRPPISSDTNIKSKKNGVSGLSTISVIRFYFENFCICDVSVAVLP